MFETFNEVRDENLRAYNRVMFAKNISKEFGTETLKEYLGLFDQTSRNKMFIVGSVIRNKGEDYFKREVLSKIEPEELDED